MSPFLDLIGKARVYNHWIGVRPGLIASELKVLYRLLHHQNPKTGRCDPSIARLSVDTGISTRMVRKAIKGLEGRGAIRVLSIGKGTRNRYSIMDLRKNPPKEPGNQGSKTGEPQFTKARNPSSPEKEKEKERKRPIKNLEPDQPVVLPDMRAERRSGDDRLRREELLEKQARKVFDERGLGYADLISLPSKKLQEVKNAFCDGRLTLDEAVEELYEAALANQPCAN